jgi:LEA14-like dessication related protein
MKKLLIPIGLIFIGKWIFSKIDTAKNLLFGITNIDAQVGFPFSKLVLSIKLSNPTTGTINVQSITGTVALNNKVIGSVLSVNSFVINANSDVDVDIDVQLNNLTTIYAIIATLRSKAAIVNFTGTVTAQHIAFPINYDYNFA